VPLPGKTQAAPSAWAGDDVDIEMVEAVGIEPTAEPLFHKDLQQSIAKKAESQDPSSPHSGGDAAPDLDHVVAAWPDLPEYIKAAVLALVNTAGVRP